MTQPMDLDAYFKRIGYDGPREASLDVLRALHTAHTTTIPFENLTPLMGARVELDLDALQAKLVGQRRGGYCFEQNALFNAALDALGFQVTALAARVRWMAPPDAPLGARSHMLLKVDMVDGPWLADVGFGGHILAEPIRLVAGIDQSVPGATLRLDDVGDGALMLRTRLPSGWQDVYRFDLVPQLPADYATSNWFTSTHPDSIFVNALLAERLTPEVRYSLFNRKLTVRWADGRTEQRTLADADDFAHVLDQTFNLTPPAPAEAIWAKLPAG
jgi:N-hydroxyarylamine O-acetyltransferase